MNTLSETSTEIQSPDASAVSVTSSVQVASDTTAGPQKDSTAKPTKSSTTKTRKGISIKRNIRPRLDRRLLLLSLVAGFPGVFVSMLLIWTGAYTDKWRWTLSVVI